MKRSHQVVCSAYWLFEQWNELYRSNFRFTVKKFCRKTNDFCNQIKKISVKAFVKIYFKTKSLFVKRYNFYLKEKVCKYRRIFFLSWLRVVNILSSTSMKHLWLWQYWVALLQNSSDSIFFCRIMDISVRKPYCCSMNSVSKQIFIVCNTAKEPYMKNNALKEQKMAIFVKYF